MKWWSTEETPGTMVPSWSSAPIIMCSITTLCALCVCVCVCVCVCECRHYVVYHHSVCPVCVRDTHIHTSSRHKEAQTDAPHKQSGAYRNLFWQCQKRPSIASKETYYSVKRDLHRNQRKRLQAMVSKETYYSVKRDLLQCHTRPTTVSKETYYSVKRDLPTVSRWKTVFRKVKKKIIRQKS